MSTTRQAQLPPRCPIQKRPTGPIHDPISPTPRISESYNRHHKSSSHSSILEEQPVWLDELLSDSESNSKGNFHRRSASDSSTLLDGFADSLRSLKAPKNEQHLEINRTPSALDSGCVYGPNSPRRRCNSAFSENAMISALSESVPQDLQHADGSLSVSEISCSDTKSDIYHSVGELNSDAKALKRHSGQRSRVRKLQYIAELERTVEVLQTLESELAITVASLLQQHVALSLENSKLKQQMIRLQQEKLMMEDEYQSLKKELERLKYFSANLPESNIRMYLGHSSSEVHKSEATWKMLDMGKLNLS